MSTYLYEVPFIEGKLCKGRLFEQVHCQFTVKARDGNGLSCAYCPFGQMIASQRQREQQKEVR